MSDLEGAICDVCQARVGKNGCCADARNEYDRVAELCHVLMTFYHPTKGHTDACPLTNLVCLETCRRGRNALMSEGYWTGPPTIHWSTD